MNHPTKSYSGRSDIGPVSSGFVLVELMVVIVVLIFLGGLLLPSLSVARDKTRQAICLQNLNRLGMALSRYRADEGCFPPPINGSGTWHLKLMPYMDAGKKKMNGPRCWDQRDDRWRCPALKEIGIARDGFHYGMNVFVSHWYQGNPEKIPNPKTMMLLADAIYYGVGGFPHNPSYGGAAYAIEGPCEHIGLGTVDRTRHAEGANHLFVDGHGEWRRGMDIPLANNAVFWGSITP